MTYLKETTIRVSLINIVTVAHKMYGRDTEISSCGLPRCGRILLAAATFDARLRRLPVKNGQRTERKAGSTNKEFNNT
jgi:hypothetical protein